MTDQTPNPWSRPQEQADPSIGAWSQPDSTTPSAPIDQPLYPGGPPSSSFGGYPATGYPGPADQGPSASTTQPYATPNPYATNNPYATPNPYGAPNPYVTAGYPAAPLRNDYAPWGKRVGAFLLDNVVTYLGLIVFYVGYGLWLSDVVRTSDLPSISQPGILVMIVSIAIMLVGTGINIYNRWIVAGRTGQSFGKRVTKIKLIGEDSGVPIGPLNAFLRDLVHTLDGFAYVGYLWPLWDQRRQTFSDKLMKTVVIRADASTDESSSGPGASS